MKSIRFLAAARRELLAQVFYYSESETGLGLKFVRSVEQALAIAVQFRLQAPQDLRQREGSPFEISPFQWFIWKIPRAL
jgi:hypothetical protein